MYSGNTQGRHPNETGARGVYVVTVNEVDNNRHVDMEFVPVDVVRWEQGDLNIHDINSADLKGRLQEIVEDLQRNADGRSLVYRIRLHGRGPLHTQLAQPDELDELTTWLNETWQDRRPFAWCGEIRDNTRSEIDRDQLRKGEDFIGDFLKLTDERSRDQNLQNMLKEELKPLFEHNRAKQHLDDILDTEANARFLLEAAEDTALDLLIAEDPMSGSD